MLGLKDWIIEPKFFKAYFRQGAADAAAMLACETRSGLVERRLAWPRPASAFAWKV